MPSLPWDNYLQMLQNPFVTSNWQDKQGHTEWICVTVGALISTVIVKKTTNTRQS